MPASDLRGLLGDKPVTPALETAQAAAHAAATAWRAAEVATDSLRHAAQDLINEAAARRAAVPVLDESVVAANKAYAAEHAKLAPLNEVLADAKIELATAKANLTARQGDLGTASPDQVWALAEAVNLAFDSVADAETGVETAQARLDEAHNAVDQAERAYDYARRKHHDADTLATELESRVPAAERAVAEQRANASALQAAWWTAKEAAEREVAEFNLQSPVEARGAVLASTAPQIVTTSPEGVRNTVLDQAIPDVLVPNAPPRAGQVFTEPTPSTVDTPRPTARRGPSPELSFEAQPDAARIDALAADLAETDAKRVRQGYLPATVEVSGPHARFVVDSLRANGIVAQVGHADGTSTDVVVDHDLKRPGGWVPPAAPTGVKVTDTVITADGPQAPHPILSDQSWRHSDAPSAEWSRPADPVSSQDILAAREAAPVSSVRSEDGGVLTTSTITPDGIDLKAWRGPIAYDKRTFEVDGKPVQDYTVKVFLNGSGPAVDALKARTVEGVETMFNGGHRLPSGGQLHVTVEFTDSPAQAHGRIAVTDPNGRANQLNWPVDTDARRLAHEVGHFLGLQDEYVEPGQAKPVFQHQDGRGRVVGDDGLMTAGIDSPDAAVKPRNLWLIETRSDALASSNTQPPLSFDPSLAPLNAPPPASQPPVSPEQQTMLDLHGVYAEAVDGVDPNSSLVNAVARTVAPDSPAARQALVDHLHPAQAATIDELAAAAKARVHVLGLDGTFTSHGPITGAPVHLVQARPGPDGGTRYLATKENVHIGRPGVDYPGPTKLPVHGAQQTVHRGEFEIETIAGRHHVRIYTAVVNPATFDLTDPANPKSAYKDIQQDPTSGKLNMSTGSNAQMWAGAGRPQRALQWLAKYEHTDGGKPIDPSKPALGDKRPILRSFLVPLDTFSKITSGATVEGALGATAEKDTYNVDQRGEPNQFGIGGDHLTELIKNAQPGSLVSYPSNPTEGFDHSDQAGRITPATNLYGRLGLGPDFRTDAIGKAYDPWFSWAKQPNGSWKFEGFRNDAHRLHEIAVELREHHVTWQQGKQGKQDSSARKADALIVPDAESIPNPRPGQSDPADRDGGYPERVKRLNQFLNEVGPAASNVEKIKKDVLSTAPDVLRGQLATVGTPAVDDAAFQQVMRDSVVPDAVRDASKTVDLTMKNLKGKPVSRADLDKLLLEGHKPKSGPKLTFADAVITPTVDKFAGKVVEHESLALLTADSRRQVADSLKARLTDALTAEFANLDSLEPLAKGGRRNGWLSGPRLTEFDSRVAARMVARPMPDTGVSIDTALLADVAQNKVLATVVTNALDSFTGQDLANSTPDHLKSVVAAEVLPKLAGDIAAALRGDPSLALADQGFRGSIADVVAREAHRDAAAALAGFTFDPVDAAEVDALMSKVPEIATQAEIGSLIAADSDRIALDFNTRLQQAGIDPFLNSYHLWNSDRGAVFEAQREFGGKLSAAINSEGRDAHAVVDQLIAEYRELNRKFDEVATAPQLTPERAPNATDRHTFYEHAQMVLGQYFALTANENPDTRLIPVDALAKAILFHDIEKNNAKNQYGDGQGRHDREPEHKLAVQMMDRYRGLWGEHEFAAVRAIVDSDPFGFYLRNKITADDAFTFIDDLAAQVGDPASPPDPNRSRKLFDEFHQYYQADFSSYTTHSEYTDRDGNTKKGPNSFTDRFQPGPDGIKPTADRRHFQYAENSDAARRMSELAAMFRDPATVAEHRDRIRDIADTAPPSAPPTAEGTSAPAALDDQLAALIPTAMADASALMTSVNDVLATDPRRFVNSVAGLHLLRASVLLHTRTAEIGDLIDQHGVDAVADAFIRQFERPIIETAQRAAFTDLGTEAGRTAFTNWAHQLWDTIEHQPQLAENPDALADRVFHHDKGYNRATNFAQAVMLEALLPPPTVREAVAQRDRPGSDPSDQAMWLFQVLADAKLVPADSIVSPDQFSAAVTGNRAELGTGLGVQLDDQLVADLRAVLQSYGMVDESDTDESDTDGSDTDEPGTSEPPAPPDVDGLLVALTADAMANASPLMRSVGTALQSDPRHYVHAEAGTHLLHASVVLHTRTEEIAGMIQRHGVEAVARAFNTQFERPIIETEQLLSFADLDTPEGRAAFDNWAHMLWDTIDNTPRFTQHPDALADEIFNHDKGYNRANNFVQNAALAAVMGPPPLTEAVSQRPLTGTDPLTQATWVYQVFSDAGIVAADGTDTATRFTELVEHHRADLEPRLGALDDRRVAELRQELVDMVMLDDDTETDAPAVSRGPAPTRSFDFAPGSTALDAEQSASVDTLAAALVETAATRTTLGYQPPKVQVSGVHAPVVKAALDSTLGGSIEVGITEGGRPNGADVHVDWALQESTASIDEAHTRHGEPTPAGISHHRGDPVMGDLPRRVPNDPRYFTADVHITPDGQARIGDRAYSPEQYGDLLRRNGWDGRTPIRLIGCDAGSNNFASRLSTHTGAQVLAPTKPAWTDSKGRVFTADAEVDAHGNRHPRIPPNGEWETHRPDGTRTKASEDGFVPGTRDKHDLSDAKDRAGDTYVRDPRFAHLPAGAPPDPAKPQLLETLDPSQRAVDENGLITHYRGQPIDGYLRDALTDRAKLIQSKIEDRSLMPEDIRDDPRRKPENWASKNVVCVSVSVDHRTGRVYESINGGTTDVIPAGDLHPALRARQEAMRGNPQADGSTPGYIQPDRHPDRAGQPMHDRNGAEIRLQFPLNDSPTRHAEVKNVNRMLRDRGVPDDVSPAELDRILAEMRVDNAFTPPGKGPNADGVFPDIAACCANCTRMIDGVPSSTEKYTEQVGHLNRKVIPPGVRHHAS